MSAGTRSVSWSSALLEGIVRLVQTQSKEPVVDVVCCDSFYIVCTNTSGWDGELTVSREPGELGLDFV